MNLKTTLTAIISCLIIATVGILCYVFWPAAKSTIDGSKYYTADDVQNAYDNGYTDGCNTETELTSQVKYYKDLVDNYYIQVTDLNSEITNLTTTNTNLQSQVDTLTTTKTELETQVKTLEQTKSDNEKTISENETTISSLKNSVSEKTQTISNLNSQIDSLNTQIDTLNSQIATDEETIETKNNQISDLEAQVKTLQSQVTDKTNEIAILNNTITSLQNSNTQLEKTNSANAETIATLNSQVTSLNNQVNNLLAQVSKNSDTVSSLNSKISQLEKSVAYYEQYISQLESGEQVVATFVYDGSVYNVQILAKGATASVTTPTSTDYVIFNNWTVNGEAVDLSSYTISTNTKFVADITYKYAVTFVSDDTTIDTQIVTAGDYATAPTAPTKTGYTFDGWAINNTITDVATNAISANTTFTAKFTKLYTVTFVNDDTTLSTQSVRAGAYATAPTMESTTYKVFNGWKVNGAFVDTSSYPIYSDTSFVADVTTKYDVAFVADGKTVSSSIVASGSYITAPTNPTKDGYDFDGWTIDNIVTDVATNAITADTTYTAKFTKLYTVEFMYEDTTISTQTIRNGEYATAPTVESTTYKVFNGWKTSSVTTDPTTFAVYANTVFTADITYKYAVTFVSDDTTIDTQIVTAGNYATAPTDPIKDGYEFDGWSIDGENVVDITTTEITANTTFTAIFKVAYAGTVLSETTVTVGPGFVYDAKDYVKSMFGDDAIDTISYDLELYKSTGNSYYVNAYKVTIYAYNPDYTQYTKVMYISPENNGKTLDEANLVLAAIFGVTDKDLAASLGGMNALVADSYDKLLTKIKTYTNS